MFKAAPRYPESRRSQSNISKMNIFRKLRVKMGTIVMKTINERVSKNLEYWIRIRVKRIQIRTDQERSRYITWLHWSISYPKAWFKVLFIIECMISQMYGLIYTSNPSFHASLSLEHDSNHTNVQLVCKHYRLLAFD